MLTIKPVQINANCDKFVNFDKFDKFDKFCHLIAPFVVLIKINSDFTSLYLKNVKNVYSTCELLYEKYKDTPNCKLTISPKFISIRLNEETVFSFEVITKLNIDLSKVV